jgi:uncharacterized glyoxalase superfamily protein PhnB
LTANLGTIWKCIGQLLLEKGLSVDTIAQDQLFGHDYFQFADPDGNGITVYTSHAGALSV